MSTGPEFSDRAALGDARAWLRHEAMNRGARCPCCSQFAKVYRRSIGSRMVTDLMAVHRHAGRGWCYLPDAIGYNGGDSAKLRYWDLIEPEPGPDGSTTDGNRRCRYRVTERGVAFLAGRARVPRWALVFDGRLMRLDDSETVTVQDCLGDRFSLAELLARAASDNAADEPADPFEPHAHTETP